MAACVCVSQAGRAAAFVVLAANVVVAQTDVSALVDRASAYVESFQQKVGSVVAEERYEQKLRRIPNPTSTSVQQRGGGGPQETTLVLVGFGIRRSFCSYRSSATTEPNCR